MRDKFIDTPAPMEYGRRESKALSFETFIR